MKTIFFVRHGQTKNNLLENEGTFVNDFPLNNEGISQINTVKNYFEKQLIKPKPSIIISSPLQRTQQTATIIGNSLKIPITYSDDLLEFNPGLLSDKKIAEIISLYKNIDPKDLPHFRLEGGESWFDISGRTNAVIRKYIDTSHSNFMIISHASVIQICINSLLGIDPELWLRHNEIENGGIKVLQYHKGRYSLINRSLHIK